MEQSIIIARGDLHKFNGFNLLHKVSMNPISSTSPVFIVKISGGCTKLQVKIRNYKFAVLIVTYLLLLHAYACRL